MLRCVHCLNPAGNTRDHVFPGSWYPDGTPGDVQRPTAPSCKPCNGRSGKQENYLLGRLGLCIDPTKAESAGIAAKALRAVGIGVEGDLSAKEKVIRAKLKKKLIQETMPYSQVDGKPGVLPGFGPHNEVPRESQIAVSVNAETLKDVCRKIVRGLEHNVANRYVAHPYVLDVFFIEDEAAERLAIGFGLPRLYLGPGFHVQRAGAHDDLGHVIYRITIWDTLVVHGSIIIPEPTNL
jgi:hypothetical protein